MGEKAIKIIPTEATYASDTRSQRDFNSDTMAASVLVSEHGRTIIHTHVVARIAAMAVREVEGVHGLSPAGPAEALTAFARRVVGATMREFGVQVEVGKLQAAVDVRIVAAYGSSLVTIAKGIRKLVRDRVQTMTGLEVVEVNIEVVDLFFEHRASGLNARILR